MSAAHPPSSSARVPRFGDRPTATSRTLSTREVACLSGVSTHTLRWYERVGLLPDLVRNSAGRRRFTYENVRWINVLRALRGTSMAVSKLQHLTRLQRAGTVDLSVRLVQVHRAQLLAVIAQLGYSLRVLDVVESQLAEGVLSESRSGST
jgi:DNA-binding transcriptional MerR regulator